MSPPSMVPDESTPAHHSPRCITCSDEGIPMRLTADPHDGLAVCVDEQGRESEVMTALVASVGRDDWVLVHAGTALLRLDIQRPDSAETSS